MTDLRALLITIPGALPRELSPNWQPRSEGARYIKASHIKAMKDLFFLHAVDARNCWEIEFKQDWIALEKAELWVTIFLTNRMKPWDSTNARSALKYGEDSLVKAQIIKDDSPEHLIWHDIHWLRGDPSVDIYIEGY